MSQAGPEEEPRQQDEQVQALEQARQKVIGFLEELEQAQDGLDVSQTPSFLKDIIIAGIESHELFWTKKT